MWGLVSLGRRGAHKACLVKHHPLSRANALDVEFGEDAVAGAYEKIVVDYTAQRPQYNAFTATLEALIKNLLQSQGIEFFAIEARTKEEDSLTEKLQREDKAGRYKQLEDITDLTGIRIIAYLEEDCDKISNLIQNAFTIDAANSVSKTDELDADKFGYLSTHYVVKLPTKRTSFLEYARFVDMKAELQVRTLLQHTWAAIDWKFRYKEENEAPKAIRRRLFRISALLEAADNEFSAVKIALSNLQLEYEQKIGEESSDIAIDTESVKSYIITSETAKSIISNAKSAGLRVLRLDNPRMPLGSFVRTARSLGIKTIKELDERLIPFVPEVSSLFDRAVKEVSGTGRAQPLQLYPVAVVRYTLIAASSKKDALRALREQPVTERFKKPMEDYVDSKE